MMYRKRSDSHSQGFPRHSLRRGYRNFPYGKLFVGLLITAVIIYFATRIHGWLMYAGLLVSLLTLYFGVGTMLFRNGSAWRRVGVKGYSTWKGAISTRRALREHVPEWNDERLWCEALIATLRNMYPSVSGGEIEKWALKLIRGATGKGMTENICEYLVRRGKSKPEAMRIAQEVGGSLQSENRLGDGIIVYSLSKVIELEFGQAQADKFWNSVGRGDIIRVG